MKTLRVLQVGMTPNPGGIESFIMNYYRNMDLNKIQFDFVNMYGDIAYQDEIIKLGGRIYKIPFFKKHPLKNYKEMQQLIKEQKYKIVHVNMLSAAYDLPLIAAEKNGANCIIAHSHNSFSPPGIIRKSMDLVNKSRMLKYATHLFACSEQAGKWMFKENKSKKPVHILNNAIDSTKFSYSPETRVEVRLKYNLHEKLVIGHVGRYQYQKNHTFLIDVFYEIYKRNSKAVLLLIGEGELKEKITEKVKSLGIENAVRFLGIRSDINDLMQAMDVFLFPSLFEGLGIAAIEAQAVGLPCFLSDSIPKEVNITGLVKYISLKSTAETWAITILESMDYFKRTDVSDRIAENGYDIKQMSCWLENFYLLHGSK
ncbi:Glycosyltransferase involved in cell wall bisynthesis [Paenibacillus sophorae]|uniref:Glycosyltransferase family 1 protein n=1 Tax=Paenibacillus sophorae TaxID=1333845 RepID=A0A1H8QHP0_9BACL|nr:glycosyltransferase family 1 protein [Paenibacillus sophorae]QWU15127.1 glycosyltransferase family 1 protein [Paenibacillus sophorae]SEO53437.1 Glycosyltransferase involved in cell wall bisynthesis [Paenibacillus sophorae]